jgi:phosphoglycerate kinase
MEKMMIPVREVKTCVYSDITPGTPVLVRVDLNISWNEKDTELHDGGTQGRVAHAIPEIQKLIKQKAVVALLTHWGEPHGKSDPAWSTARLIPLLEKRLKKKVTHVSNVFGESVKSAIAQAKPGSVLLLENVRFWRAEEKDDDAFAKAVATPFALFINNAFSVSHRAHASVHAITRHLPSYAGQNVQEELKRLTKPIRLPFVCMIGGAKIETKVTLIERIGEFADTILLGGGIAIAVQLAKGDDVPGASGTFRRKEVLTAARRVLHRFERKVFLPNDVVAKPDEDKVFDVGPQTRSRYARMLADAKTVLWNGPFGIIEEKEGQEGTRYLAQTLAKTKAAVFLGGGETITFLEKEKLLQPSWNVSTGGGAMLSLLAGERMPGLEPLWLEGKSHS